MRNTSIFPFFPQLPADTMTISLDGLSSSEIMSINQSEAHGQLDHESMSIQLISATNMSIPDDDSLTDSSLELSADEMGASHPANQSEIMETSADDLSIIDPLEALNLEDHTLLDWDLSSDSSTLDSETTNSFTAEELQSLEAASPAQLNTFGLFASTILPEAITSIHHMSNNDLSISL